VIVNGLLLIARVAGARVFWLVPEDDGSLYTSVPRCATTPRSGSGCRTTAELDRSPSACVVPEVATAVVIAFAETFAQEVLLPAGPGSFL